MLMQFSTTREPVKFNAQAIITSLTGATTILIQLSPAGLIPGLMLMQLSPPTMAHSLMLMQLSPNTLDHDQLSCNFQLFPTKFCNAHLMQHYNYHQIRWILTENRMRINISLLLGYYPGTLSCSQVTVPHLLVPHLEMSYRDLTTRQATKIEI